MMMHAAVRDQMGPVHILVNNAAVVETTMFANPEADDTISEMVNTNLLGQIWVRTSMVLLLLCYLLFRIGMYLLLDNSRLCVHTFNFCFSWPASYEKLFIQNVEETLLFARKIKSWMEHKYYLSFCLLNIKACGNYARSLFNLVTVFTGNQGNTSIDVGKEQWPYRYNIIVDVI